MECVTRFRPLFYFKIRTHPGPWKTGLNIFELSSDFADFRTFKKLRGVHHTAERKLNIWKTSTVWCTPQRCIRWYLKPQSLTPQYASHCKIKLSGVHSTTESNCTLLSPNRNLCESLVAFKGTIRRYPFWGEHFYHERKELKNFFFFFTKMLTPWCHT